MNKALEAAKVLAEITARPNRNTLARQLCVSSGTIIRINRKAKRNKLGNNAMIREVANLMIKPGTEEDFLAAVTQAIPYFQTAQGCTSMRLEKVIETENHFRLIVLWETLEDHTEVFRNSAGFQKWRELAGPYFSQAPLVDHSSVVVPGFE